MTWQIETSSSENEIRQDDFMRHLVALTESYVSALHEADVKKEVVEVVAEPQKTDEIGDILAELEDIQFRLRSHLEESEQGDFALGVETGMQRAADLIESITRRYGE